VRSARTADRRPLWAFLLVLVAGLGLVLWTLGRPAADAAPPGASTPAAGPGDQAAGASGAGSVDGPIVPTRLQIPAIDVDAAVESRGTVRYRNPFTGQMVDGYGVPESMRTTSWWSDGPRPGSGQMAVVLGHSQVGGGYAVFNRLDRLRPGDDITLRDSGGAVLHLRVLGEPLTGLDKSTSALADALNRHPPNADLALVTCGGEFDRQARASEDNDVVFATVVDR
jgi:Sortase domain